MSKQRKKPHSQTMWAIKNVSEPDCVYFYADCLGYNRRQCIENFIGSSGISYTWRQFRNAGYRCVKVKITEIVK